MTWVTWKQYRQPAAIAAVALALGAVAVLGMGRQMANAFNDGGLAACVVARDHGGRCADAGLAFAHSYQLVTLVMLVALTTVPMLLGMFMGAPLLAEELNRGTHRLAWTQGITRNRWVVVKLGLLTLAVVIAQGLVTATSWWWYSPLVQLFGGLFAGFDILGITPIAYALFAVFLGAAAGLVTRNSVLGMGITMVGFLVVRLVVAFAVRPYYLAPIQLTWDSRQLGPHSIHFGPGDPTQPFGWANAHGSDLSLAFNGDWRFGAVEHGFKITELYQPAARFWTFQAIEATIFLALAAIAAVAIVWWLRRVT
jgi:ABC-type transport system involved in multi-copper enzyme maturation permease subunit